MTAIRSFLFKKRLLVFAFLVALLHLANQKLATQLPFLTVKSSSTGNHTATAVKEFVTRNQTAAVFTDVNTCQSLGRTKPSQVCSSWDVNMDSWWTHHPEWEVSFENDVCFCFRKMANHTPQYAFLREIYNLQFSESTDCSKVYSKNMVSYGFGLDTLTLADRLLYGYQNKRPFQLIRNEWKYAVSPDKTFKVCPNASAFCFFLPIGKCPAGVHQINPDGEWSLDAKIKHPAQRQWLRVHVTRPQQWFRKRLYEYMKERFPWEVHTPCVAMHVRRSDVVKDGFTRKYFAIAEYLEKVPDLKSRKIKNIMLFTDDANAIDEALEFHSYYNWMYMNRTRYRGAEGKWGVHMPSNDPVMEVLAIYATFRLAMHCDILVHSKSAFSDGIYDFMSSTGRNITRIEIDKGEGKRPNNKYAGSNKLLESKLDELRKKKGSNVSINS